MRRSKVAWSWIAGTVIISLLVVNAVGLAVRITGKPIAAVASLGMIGGGLNVDAPPTRTR